MNVFQRSIVDEAGNVMPLASVEVRDQVTSNLVQLYDDYDGFSPIGNPIAADTDGFVRFYVGPGRYRIEATSGLISKVWEDEVLGLIDGEGIQYQRTAAEISAGITPTNYDVQPYNVDRYFNNSNPGTTNATTGILAAITATPAGGLLTFGRGPYLINANSVVLNKKLDTHFDSTVFYCPATANQVALQWGLANSGWFNTQHTGRFEIYRASAGGSLLPVMNGSQTAASQLLGTGVKILNMARANFSLSSYVFGFKYGHYWESDNGIGCTLCRYEFLEGQNNLIDFYFKPVSHVSDVNYITRHTIGDFMTTFNNTHYSSIVGTRFIEIDKNGESMDALTFEAGTMQNVKEYKLITNASECVWRDVYWDLSTATETDIWLKSGSSMNTIETGAGQRLQSVLDEGTLNSMPHPFYHQTKVISPGYPEEHYTYSGVAQIPLRIRPIGVTLTDDDFVDLPTGGSGIVAVGCGNEGGLWHVAADATCTKLAGTTNTAASGSDNLLSVYDVGTNARVINRLGSTLKAVIFFVHWI